MPQGGKRRQSGEGEGRPPLREISPPQKKAAQGNGERILVVDDEESVRIMLNGSLRLLGYEVEMAENGEKALARLDEGFKPDLILLDFMMPGMGGEAFGRNWINGMWRYRP